MAAETFLTRLRDELAELRDRLEKLRLFVHPANNAFMDLADAERLRLYRQLDAMSAYEMVLGERAVALGLED